LIRAEIDPRFIRRPGARKTRLPQAIGDEAPKEGFVVCDRSIG
jgi:hypothetical protein